jgi:hypothetical protein
MWRDELPSSPISIQNKESGVFTMSKFVMSVALSLASFAGVASTTVQATEPVQAAVQGQEESATLYGPYAFYSQALAAQDYLYDLGYNTRIVLSGGVYYVQAW